MAWLEPNRSSTRFQLCFRWGGRKFKHALRGVTAKEAESVRKRTEETLGLIDRGRLTVPHDADFVAFVVSDGRVATPVHTVTVPPAMTIKELFDRYLEIVSNGAMEANTVSTIHTHFKHILASLGSRCVVKDVTLDDVQKHIDRRSRKKVGAQSISAGTIRAEITTFRACWNWAHKAKKLTDVFPGDGLMFPKQEEKPPFQTWAEIERRVAAGGLTPHQVGRLWNALFLTKEELAEFLAYAKGQPAPPFLYPMICFAAHTGARRSELLRVEIHDLDFETGTVLLREKKRSKGMRTTRRVPLSDFLVAVLREWLKVHPGGPKLFVQNAHVKYSRTVRNGPTAATCFESHDYLRRLLDRGRWKVLRGWHVFRHSFCSNCAACGVDQRLINAWVGHQTEEMVKRYRHLIPHQERVAIAAVFGTTEKQL